MIAVCCLLLRVAQTGKARLVRGGPKGPDWATTQTNLGAGVEQKSFGAVLTGTCTFSCTLHLHFQLHFVNSLVTY